MQYISPFTLLSVVPENAHAAAEIKLAGKRLLAEFELKGTTTLETKRGTISRNDVLKLIDSLGDPAVLSWHMLIAADEALLHFLEKGEINTQDTFSIASAVTPAFLDWVQPCFCTAFSACALKLLQARDAGGMQVLLPYCRWLHANEEWTAWSNVEAYLQQLLQGLEQLINVRFHTPPEAAVYAGDDLMAVLRLLPGTRFAPWFNRYAGLVLELAVKEFNNNRKQYAYSLIADVKTLPVSEELRVQLGRTEHTMQHAAENEAAAVAGGVARSRVMAWGIIIMLACILLMNMCGILR